MPFDVRRLAASLNRRVLLKNMECLPNGLGTLEEGL